MPAAADRPVLGIVNTSPEICALLATIFAEEGFRVVTASPQEFKRAAPTAYASARLLRSAAVILAIARPYEQIWQLFRTVAHSPAGRRTRFVLTCLNTRALESLVGATPALELLGKPYGLDQN